MKKIMSVFTGLLVPCIIIIISLSNFKKYYTEKNYFVIYFSLFSLMMAISWIFVRLLLELKTWKKSERDVL